eukprot:s3485_g5.t1
MTLFMWRMFVQAWPQPSRQHDVVEFAAFIMRKALLVAYDGHWSAWDPEAPHSRKDWSSTHAPIIVDPILPECVLQDAVAVWEQDHLVRGLSKLPKCIMFHIRRFVTRRDGSVAKQLSRVAMPELILQLPAGEYPSRGLSKVTYRVVAVVAHYGVTPTSGHYRAFLVDLEGHWHVTDDSKRAQRAQTTLLLCGLTLTSFSPSVTTEPASLGIRASRYAAKVLL